MIFSIILLLKTGLQAQRSLFLSRKDLVLENLALRQQLAIFAQKQIHPRLKVPDRLFWVLLSRTWSRWKGRLIIVKPDTVVRWHREGFRLYWRWISNRGRKTGRPRINAELRELICKMVDENHWGAPRIHGELLKLGYVVGQATVSRLMPRKSSDPNKSQCWKTFLKNHSDVLAAMDFFVVPTATFGLLYGFFIIHHGRRKILHFNATANPTADWVVQQFREVFPYETSVKYLIMDRDCIFNSKVLASMRAIGIEPVKTSVRCPQENGIAERWIRRLALDYISYYNKDRTHLSLAKDAPESRVTTPRPSSQAHVIAIPRIGGLHHRYEWKATA